MRTMCEQIHVMYTEEEVCERIRQLGAQISEDLNGEPVKLICILKGASFFACELAKRITSPVYMDFMYVSSYGNGTESSGQVKITKDLESSVEGENVLIAEDIIDSGNTLHFLSQEMKDRGQRASVSAHCYPNRTAVWWKCRWIMWVM